MDPLPASILPPDLDLEPEGFVVVLDAGDRMHFLDWGGPDAAGVLLIHGLSQTAWTWAPVARCVRGPRRTVALDLPGHGLSDAPVEGYELETLAAGAIAVAEGSGLLDDRSRGIVVAGHGFGAIVAAHAARALGSRCDGVVLVDGGWERLEETTGVDVDEFLRGLAEPPEVLASMTAFLADRAGFDPGSWDADQERAARLTVVETHAGRVVPATRPHALEACVRAMFTYDPLAVLPALDAPLAALVAADHESASRAAALAAVSAARVEAGRAPIEIASFPGAGHNLMRYRPAEVTAAILSIGADRGR